MRREKFSQVWSYTTRHMFHCLVLLYISFITKNMLSLIFLSYYHIFYNITKHMVSLIFLSFRLSSDHTTNLFDLPTTPFPYDMMTAENCFNMVHGCFAISVTTKDIQVGSVGSMERMHSTDRHGQKVSLMPTPLMCPFVWSLC